ncbi:hypothetical protein CPC08DRAFT_125911 [Agrocybe pediades]|nr:hypothetical protein CPC08DRAFT_125911 [Agrocybe pediades]
MSTHISCFFFASFFLCFIEAACQCFPSILSFFLTSSMLSFKTFLLRSYSDREHSLSNNLDPPFVLIPLSILQLGFLWYLFFFFFFARGKTLCML